MRHKKLKLSTLLLLTIGLTVLQAQETISATGGNASGNGGTVSYTIGQIVYTTNTEMDASVAQGVQQPFEISVASVIEQAKDININCSAYPNPTTDIIILEIDVSATLSIQSMSYQLCDISGKLCDNKKIEGNKTTVSMNNLTPATYFLKIINNNKEIKTFKIIKN